VVSIGGGRMQGFGTDWTSVVKNSRKMFRLYVTSNISDRLVFEDSTEGADPERTLTRDVHVKIFCGSEGRIVFVA